VFRFLLLLTLLVLPGFALGGDESPLLLTHGNRSRPQVALTFDLCETRTKPAGFDPAIVAILQEKQAAATFFSGGLWLQNHPQEAQLLASDPLFELGNHSWSHPDLRQADAATISDEINATEKLLTTLTGHSSRLFRLPFGYYDERALKSVAANDVRIIHWDVVTGDPDRNVLAADILNAVKHGAKNGSIVIMHANGRGWHTAEALPQVIDLLRQRGFKLVTVSELLQL
jgi:peptidoglycan/xylan/chitin deacetylase (PgdA/CDA1 family)